MIMNFYNEHPIDTISESYPQTVYSVNFDYEFPITHKKTLKNRDQLDEYIEDCGVYGYSMITEKEYQYYIRATN